jgi:hypothetical protein
MVRSGIAQGNPVMLMLAAILLTKSRRRSKRFLQLAVVV